MTDGLEAARAAVMKAARSFGGPNRGVHGEISEAWVKGALDNYRDVIRADESALRAAAREALIKEGARPMLTVDDRCKSPECTHKDIYRMLGKCANCHAAPVLVLFTVGHEARRVACPSCGVERVYTTRLATPEEIPVA